MLPSHHSDSSRTIDPKIIEQMRERIRARKRGLGDMVADGLAAIGITKERVAAVTGKPCGCSKRQQKLNDLGKKFGIG